MGSKGPLRKYIFDELHIVKGLSEPELGKKRALKRQTDPFQRPWQCSRMIGRQSCLPDRRAQILYFCRSLKFQMLQRFFDISATSWSLGTSKTNLTVTESQTWIWWLHQYTDCRTLKCHLGIWRTRQCLSLVESQEKAAFGWATIKQAWPGCLPTSPDYKYTFAPGVVAHHL